MIDMDKIQRSKTYRYSLGHVWFKASTVRELRDFLAQFPDDMPVIATWEGTVHSLSSPEIVDFEGGKALQFDAEFDLD